MVRIAGFHPADPGSIPGDEGSSRNDVKSPRYVSRTRVGGELPLAGQ